MDRISLREFTHKSTNFLSLNDKNYKQWVFKYTFLELDKDLGLRGDITSKSVFNFNKRITARIIAKDYGILSGKEEVIYFLIDAEPNFRPRIKNNFEKKKITEISASNKLLNFRKKNKKFKFSSFPTISGSGPNGAIIHYKATEETNRTLKKGDVYLVDSGGQYEFGTTDVTRTISLKNSDKRIKNIFTRVLKGHIAVADYKFKKNTFGSVIDKEARKFLKQIGLDYHHGTGHGVGYFLNVHEGPQAISKSNRVKLEEGMILSNEPGYYEKNKFGIRIENLIYIKKKKNKKYFENLTMVPIEKDLINEKMLNSNEIQWLNNYHKKVFKNLKKSMNGKEIIELKKACSAI